MAARGMSTRPSAPSRRTPSRKPTRGPPPPNVTTWARSRQSGPVIDKIEEELGELRAELAASDVDQARLTDELGDVLFAVTNLARHCKIDPEAALRATNDKFERRFRHIERRLAEAGRKPADATLDEMEALWQEAKTRV